MNKKIFILNGMAGSGKDTFANMVSGIIPTRHISIVDKPKFFAKHMGWDGSKEEKDRKFLCDLKHLMDEYNDFNYNYIRQQVELFNQDPELQFLFIDMRETNQIERAKKEFGAYTVFVKRDNVEKITSNFADAQTLNKNYQYDIIVDNCTTLEHLMKLAQDFAKKLSEPKVKNNDDNVYTITINTKELEPLKELFADILNDEELNILIKEVFNSLFKR